MPVPGPGVRGADRREGAAGAGRAGADRADRRPARRADRARGVAYAYRNKLEYSFTATEDGVDLGFHRAGRWDEVIGIEECLLTTDLGNAVRLAVREWAREEKLEPYDQETGEGYLRHLVYREGRNTGQALALLVTAPGERFEPGYFVDVLRRFPEVRSIHWAINDTPAERTNMPTRLLWGGDAIEEEILGLRFRIRPGAFFQTNTEMAAQLYELAREYAALEGTENVFDLYCGTGTIGLALAGGAKAVWGVEISEESVACAIENAELNGIENTQFFAGNVGQSLEELSSGPGGRTSSSSTRRGQGSRARPCAGQVSCRRIASCTSPATRPRLRRMCRSSATSSATSSCGRARSTCSRTRRTSSRSRCSSAADARASRPLRCRGVRATRRERGARADRRSGAGSRCTPREAPGGRRRPIPTRARVSREEPGHAEPAPADTKAESRSGREEEREEDDVGRAKVHAAAIREREGDRDALEEPRLLFDDVAGRPECHGPDVHPRDDHRDERDPPELLEERDEPEAGERERRELRHVRGRFGSDEVEPDPRERRDSGDDDEEMRPPRVHDGEREPDRRHERGHDEERDDGEVDAGREVGEPVGDCAVDDERCEQPGERERAPAADQYGGCSPTRGRAP